MSAIRVDSCRQSDTGLSTLRTLPGVRKSWRMETQTHAAATNAATSRQWPGGRYVVGLDGSDPSIEALRHAIRLASLTGAQIEAVVAWNYPINYGPRWSPTDWAPEVDARHILRNAVEAVVGKETPSFIDLVVRQGGAAAVLIDQSRDADLLVVGSRGHGGFAGLILGSVSTACAEHAHCPVLVVHGTRARTANPVERAALDL